MRLSQKDIELEINTLINNIPCQTNLQLKVGAIVMCTINLDLDNGIATVHKE